MLQFVIGGAPETESLEVVFNGKVRHFKKVI